LQIAKIQRGIVDVIMRGLWTKIKGRFDKEVSRVIASSSIVCCTMDMARSTPILRRGGSFDLVVGDEAGQVSDAQLALFAAVPDVACGVLVGDEKQLGSFVQMTNVDEKESPFAVLVDRARERLAGRCIIVTSIYRCHP
jgi:superfamily I DNA and/or RNA helicase